MLGTSPEMTKSEALKLEYRIKHVSADKKISELTGKENEMTLKQDLKTLQKQFKAIEKKMTTLSNAVEKSKKTKSVKISTAKSIKAKTVKAGSVKNTPTKKITSKLTATDQVLKIVKGSKKGVDTTTLMKKTGFNQKKVWNIIQRAYKQAKIKRVGKGLYLGA
jgi:hypothetical protein